MKRLNSIIDGILFYYLSASLAALVGICFIQIVVRYLFSASFAWAEEVSIILLVWATWGGCFAVKKGAHLRILFVVDVIGPTLNTIINAFPALIMPGIIIGGFLPVSSPLPKQGLLRSSTESVLEVLFIGSSNSRIFHEFSVIP